MSNKNYYYNKNRKRNYQSNQVEEKKKSKFRFLWLLAPAYLISLLTYYGISTGNLGGVKKATDSTTTTTSTTTARTTASTIKKQLSNLPQTILDWPMECFDTPGWTGYTDAFSTWHKHQTITHTYDTSENYSLAYTNGEPAMLYEFGAPFFAQINKYTYKAGAANKPTKFHGVYSLNIEKLLDLDYGFNNQSQYNIVFGLYTWCPGDATEIEESMHWLDENNATDSKYFRYDQANQTAYFRDDIFESLNYTKLAIGIELNGLYNSAGLEEEVMSAFHRNTFTVDYYAPDAVTEINGEKVLGDATKEVYVDIKDNVTLFQLVNEITATDVFGQPCELSVNKDMTFNSAGLYPCLVTARTTNGQQATLTLNVHATDYTPTIHGNFEDVIQVNYSSTISKADILSLFSITDYNGSSVGCTLDLKETFSLNSSMLATPKTYTLVGKDGDGRKVEQTIQVQLVDDIGPIIAYTPTLAVTSIKCPLSVEQLKDIIIKANNLDTKNIKSIKLTNNDYTANADKLGRYSVAYEIATVDGQIQTGTIDLQTSEAEEKAKEVESGWDKFCDSMAKFFKKIWHWLTFRGWNE